MLVFGVFLLCLSHCFASPSLFKLNVTLWHVVWVGGQSNSVGTNSQLSGNYPTWPTTPLIQNYCWNNKRVASCPNGTFTSAQVPLFNEANVGFSQTFSNLLLQTLPVGHGVIIVNTGVGGTGFEDGDWTPPNGSLVVQSVNAMQQLANQVSLQLGGDFKLDVLLWHQGEEDAGDNRVNYHSDYCTYLINDLSALIDYLRLQFPKASPSTPFVDGQLLPYWIDNVVNGTGDVPHAITSLNTSRACTATANSRIFADFKPDKITPNGDPKYRSGASGDVIHFDATQQFFFGFEYWSAYLRSTSLTSVVPSSQTQQCPNANIQPSVTLCG